MSIIKTLALAAAASALLAAAPADAAPRTKARPAWSPRDFTGVYEGEFLTRLDFAR